MKINHRAPSLQLLGEDDRFEDIFVESCLVAFATDGVPDGCVLFQQAKCDFSEHG